ncbi:MAG: hypothetical protein JXQ71_05605 [Verrucomicrobia bacterium]|nr:hypothetical protein [Verrucomicrobiota bacterium]
MNTDDRFASREDNITPALREVVLLHGLRPDKLSVVLPVQGVLWACQDRHRVRISDTQKSAEWHAAALRELGRGDVQPPPHLDRFPPAYVPLFSFLERHVLRFCSVLGDKTDQEFEEAYSHLHRRPDGRSLGPLHDFLWQVSAVMLATRIVSLPEFEGVIGALLASARRWGLRPISRNYIGYLRNNMPR